MKPAGLVSWMKTGLELLRERERIGKISTGSRSLDGILGGGVETGSLTEFSGEYGCGKTQLMYQLCINVQRRVGEGGLSRGAIFVDTEGTFRPDRIVQISERIGMDPDDVLSRILVMRVYSVSEQLEFPRKVERVVAEGGIGLIAVDSVTHLFRSEYLGRENLAERQRDLCKHLAELKRLSELYELAVVMTNQVVSRPDGLGGQTLPIGGNILGHAVTHRVYLYRGKGERRTAVLVDSPNMPPRTATFRITEAGISD